LKRFNFEEEFPDKLWILGNIAVRGPFPTVRPKQPDDAPCAAAKGGSSSPRQQPPTATAHETFSRIREFLSQNQF
jgi:hypothetical protein